MADRSGLTQQEVASGRAGSVRPGGRTARTTAAVTGAALEELARVGYDALALEDVAARAGVHKTTVYRRWGTKEALVSDALVSVAQSAVEVADTGDVDSDLRLLARSVAATLRNPLGGGLVRAMVGGAARSEVVARLVGGFWAQRTAEAGTVVRRAVERGQLPAGTDPGLVVRAVGAPLYHRLLVTLEALDDETADRAAAAASAAARAGVFVVDNASRR